MFETITNCSPGWSGSWAICKINVKRQSTRLKQGSEYWIHKKNWPAIIFQLSFTSYFLKTVSMSSGSQWSAETWHSCAQVKQTVRFARKILVSKVSLGYFCFSPRVQVSFTRHDAPKSFFFFLLCNSSSVWIRSTACSCLPILLYGCWQQAFLPPCLGCP